MCSTGMLSNQSGATIEVIEIFHLAPPGSHGCIILLPPHGQRVFPAAKFYRRNRISGRPSTIFINVNGVRASQSLTPQQFLHYVKISFYVYQDGRLTITGVKPKLTDFCRFCEFWYLNFDIVQLRELNHCKLRAYSSASPSKGNSNIRWDWDVWADITEDDRR
ncbi:hypothetical protein Pfo_024955 [Paulownia fortunei]|nr:hypothetical protein Pfo_024955 [Paulownia fortunei]